MWVYDNFGYVNHTATTSVMTGTPADSLIVQEPLAFKDGSGKFGIRVAVYDTDGSTCYLKVEYSTKTTPYDWNIAYVEAVDSDYGIVTSSNNPPPGPLQDYRIRDIITEYESNKVTNTVTFNWCSKQDADNYFLTNGASVRITVNDGLVDSSAMTTSLFSIDNSQPKFNDISPANTVYMHESSSFTIQFLGEASNNTQEVLLATQTVTSRFLVKVSSSDYFDLSGSTAASPSNNILKVKISDENRNRISRWDNEGKTPYITLLSSATRDNYGNYSLAKSTISFSTITWVHDTTDPTVVSSTYSIGITGDINLYLTFNEYMDILSLTDDSINGICVQKSSTSSGYFVNLDSSCKVLTDEDDSKTLEISIPYGMHDIIWAWSDSTIYLSLSSATITDLSGNYVTAIPADDARFLTTYISSQIPNISYIFPEADGYNIPRNVGVTVNFNAFLKPIVTGGITITVIKDSMNNTVSNEITGTKTFSKENKLFTFTPDEPLPGNSVIEVKVDRNFIRNFADIIMEQDLSWTFKTTLTNDIDNYLMSKSGKTAVYVPRNQLPSDGKAEFTEDIPPNPPQITPMDFVSAANTTENTWNNMYHYPFGDLTAEVVFFDAQGIAQGTDFSETAEITVDFSSNILDEDPEYLQYGLNPPVKKNTLKIYYLNETAQNWTPLMTIVDKDNNKVSADIHHFSIYTVMGAQNYDLENAHPYPVPYKPSELPDAFMDTLRSGITFTRLPSECVIEIYTIAGRLVNTLNHSDAAIPSGGIVGNYYWTPVQNSYSENVVSGVYIYFIEAENRHKSGKLMIIR
ncbi:MAG: Ig-like domain-containing protein, partial [Elusimicrobiota bacterium]